MKKILLIFLFLSPIFAIGQSLTPYMATGLSVGNVNGSTFSKMSYPTIETGVMTSNWSIAIVTGRGSFSNFKTDSYKEYWSEAKTSLFFPVRDTKFTLYSVSGIGTYFNKNTIFIEYGIGSSYMLSQNVSAFNQISNWDRSWFVSNGILYSF